MNTTSYRRSFFCMLAALVLVASAMPASAQEVIPPPEERASPGAIAHTTLENGTYVKVVYHSPRKRGREIFGELVPFDQVWRLGANEATEITLTGDVNFAGQPLDAGTYSLFAIPRQNDRATIIVNRALGQWGAFSYDENQDVLRVDVPATQTDAIHEAFTMSFEEAPGGADLVIVWDRSRVVVPIGLRVNEPGQRPSPLSLARTQLGDGTYVKVHYSSPRKRGREIFGELVPYGEMWRTAANEGSEVTFTDDVRFGGETVEAGTYTLLTIPGRDQWTVILSRQLGLNGTQSYDQTQDAARVRVPARTTRATYEPFTIRFAESEGATEMQLLWDQTVVAVPIASM